MEAGTTRGISPHHVKRLQVRLDRLDIIESLDELPAAWRCHSLQGVFEGFYAINVSAQWRLIFRFEEGNAFDVDYVQYH